MKNYHPDVYKQKVTIAYAYYFSAIELYDPKNRNFKFYIPSYYLMSHALELVLKGTWEYENDATWTTSAHGLTEISTLLTGFSFIADNRNLLKEYDDLNQGPGGLRYDNEPKEEFLPTLFHEAAELFQIIVTYIQDEYITET